ncbi:zinc-dependent metalloprotease [Flavobacterium luteum]|uniref:T9SS type A sorting domain-containing protein n=1 Tax=Flavobacterium luteum TaxID=2026654 RepID=A0A7J5AHL0_9FLAO|nr:zinc-dependent metalloprotease [Flavobacterium luteum]KAB1156888.1 T9SS type A sorting domain-containing protein [Flavobacterium luteum]
MRNAILLLSCLFSHLYFHAQSNTIWEKVSLNSTIRSNQLNKLSYSQAQLLYKFDSAKFRKSLLNVNDKFSGLSGVIVDFPNLEGNLEKFQVWENSNFSPKLQAKYPDIKSYVGKSLSDKSTTINFSVSKKGIQTMVLRPSKGSEFIESFTNDNSVYVLFDSKTRPSGKLPFDCKTIDVANNQEVLNRIQSTNISNDKTYKTLRLAISCTGEYGAYFGGVPEALAAMNATMTRVNGIFEKDLALHLNIIDENEQIIYTNPNTDPYSDAEIGTDGTWNQELQNNLTNVLGNQAYDIGHLFGASGGGGNAGCIGCVCIDDFGFNSETKGSGYTSPKDNIPEGDSFDVDYVAHELGHQLGAFHTFSYGFENSGVLVEPGSGSTIMGYAGIAEPDNLNIQDNSDPYFTYRSILQIQKNLENKTCVVRTPVTNSAPIVNAGIDFTVPSGTAYLLKGLATDIDNDSLTYCWEQNNSASRPETGSDSVTTSAKASGPNFRSFNPIDTPIRYMPSYSNVLLGKLNTTWESVSSVSRSLKFSLTVRDNNPNGAQTGFDEVTVTSRIPYNVFTAPTGVGPFKLTSQNSSGIIWNLGASQTITWDVNNTTSLPGSANVNIKLSIDGGATFPYVLASNVPNDGNQVINVPSTPSASNCRVLIEPTGNVYYAINSRGFSIAGLGSEDFELTNFRLFPNPNNGSFTIQFESRTTNEIAITIHDVRGRLILEKRFNNLGLFSQNISLSPIQKGIYIVTIKDGYGKMVKKIVVE